MFGTLRPRWTRLSEVLRGPVYATGAFARRSLKLLSAALHKGLRSLVPRSSINVVDSEAQPLDQDLDILAENDGTLTLDLPDIPTNNLEAPSIKWLLETSTDPEVFLAAASLVPQVEWPLDLDISDILPQLYDIFTSCVDIQMQIVPSLEEKTSACVTALSHLYYGRVLQAHPGHSDFICSESTDFMVFLEMGPLCKANYTILYTTINLCLPEDSNHGWFPLVSATCPDSVLEWLSHVLPYHFVTGRVDEDGERLATTVISKLLSYPSSPSTQIVANCTLLACVMVGAQVDKKDIVRIDKRCHRLIWRFFCHD
ncbi:hypothetical protein F4604DRAFT_1300199 [Suillus subluteus]|nr:hypothetical protein F4604DRAFT_1300199 [Suillus subluteus]